MSLYENWMRKAYNKEGSSIESVWDIYMPKEQKIYEYILEEKLTKLEATVKELSERFEMPLEDTIGFIDGINDALPTPYDMMSLEENTKVILEIDFERLFKKMVEYKAEHLYTLKQWNGIFDEETRKRFMKEQRTSRTVVKAKEQKVGRNDPCPCGSGKKYKFCCGA